MPDAYKRVLGSSATPTTPAYVLLLHIVFLLAHDILGHPLIFLLLVDTVVPILISAINETSEMLFQSLAS